MGLRGHPRNCRGPPWGVAGSRTPHYGSQTPLHDGSRTPAQSGAWDPNNPNTPSRWVPAGCWGPGQPHCGGPGPPEGWPPRDSSPQSVPGAVTLPFFRP